MSTEEKVLYYEDVEVKAKTKTAEDDGAKVTVGSTTAAKTTKTITSSAPLKRQRTLMEMMSVSSKDSKSEQPAKKAKIATSASPSTSNSLKSVNAGVQPLNSIPFSMQGFKDSLTDEHRELLHLECETMGISWLKILKDEITKPYFIQLKKFLQSEGVKGPDDLTPGIFPSPRNIYAWSNTPLGRVRAVIIGQDPYHGPGQAHGLCFSVPRGVAVPPSLRNIYAEIKAEYPDFNPPKHGNLIAWANSGVLLLNAALTVRSGKAASHSNKGWETFTDKVIDVVDKYGGANLSGSKGVGRGIVFLAWGAPAGKRVARLDKKKHLILQSAHPSPLSAHRGFMGNGHFKKANDWLEARYGNDGLIDWCTLDVEERPQELASSQ